jgi:hypothetical protein
VYVKECVSLHFSVCLAMCMHLCVGDTSEQQGSERYGLVVVHFSFLCSCMYRFVILRTHHSATRPLPPLDSISLSLGVMYVEHDLVFTPHRR